MKVKHELFKNVGIFTISGEINAEHEDTLKLLLMKAVHGDNRAVLNFSGVHTINRKCIRLLNKAYRTSLRLNNPIIMTGMPETYLQDIYSCQALNTDVVHTHMKTGKAPGKGGVLSGIH